MEWKKAIEEYIKTGLHELMILKLLSERDMYGYEIGKQLKIKTKNTFENSQSSLHGIFLRLTSRGFITCYTETVKGKRIRKYYHIEKSGEEYLAYGEEQSRIIINGYLDLMNSINNSG